MVILIIVAYISVGVLELSLWPKRRLKEILVYLVFLAAAGILSVLLTLDSDLTFPSQALLNLWTKLWGGGNQL